MVVVTAATAAAAATATTITTITTTITHDNNTHSNTDTTTTTTTATTRAKAALGEHAQLYLIRAHHLVLRLGARGPSKMGLVLRLHNLPLGE